MALNTSYIGSGELNDPKALEDTAIAVLMVDERFPAGSISQYVEMRRE